ncbi:MAG: hypothetical protein EBR94_06855 [Bacteroidetes bacterium]|nr:hypothetical protein [Bacteroidota bacterium]
MKISEMFASPFDVENVPNDWWLERYRKWRTEELLNCDWTQLTDAPVDSAAWATYRQELRDLTKVKDFANAELPERP